jgi:hypothetical protein
MVVIIQDDYTANLLQLPNDSVDLLIVVCADFGEDALSLVKALGRLVLKEGGNLIIAPTLADAFLAL